MTARPSGRTTTLQTGSCSWFACAFVPLRPIGSCASGHAQFSSLDLVKNRPERKLRDLRSREERLKSQCIRRLPRGLRRAYTLHAARQGAVRSGSGPFGLHSGLSFMSRPDVTTRNCGTDGKNRGSGRIARLRCNSVHRFTPSRRPLPSTTTARYAPSSRTTVSPATVRTKR